MDIDVRQLDRSGRRYKKSGVSFRVGTTNFQFISDGTPAGNQAVASMQAVCEQDYQTVKAIFGNGDIPQLPCVVTVDVNAGGAYHMTCADTGIHVIPEDAPSLLVAEFVECFQAQSLKWDCGRTSGEGLSRALAITVRPFKVLTGLDGDVQGWWNNGSPQDFVNDDSQDDQNQQANACGTLFLFYLNSLGYTWNQIINAGGLTLGVTYTNLTKDKSNPFPAFVKALSQIPQPWADNPFPSASPAPSPTPTPVPVPAPQGNGCNPFGFLNGLFGNGGG